MTFKDSAITEFTGEYGWLSNFHRSSLAYKLPRFDGTVLFPSAEHAYQAAKGYPSDVYWVINAATPGEAKRLGRKVRLVPDWEQIKKQVMLQVVLAKFTQNPDLREKLTATAPYRLIEGNHWHDNYWGQCSCNPCARPPFPESSDNRPDWMLYGISHPGHNYLGRILMAVRDVLVTD